MKMDMPSPILILGDHQLSQNNINAAKKKYSNYKWVVLSATENSPEEIRGAAGQREFLKSDKVLLINELPNKKAVRDFLLELVKLSSKQLKFIIWDSTGEIKADPKTKAFNKTWSDFIDAFKKNPSHKIVNNGEKFSEKEDRDCVKFIQDRFERAKKKISPQNALLLSEIVGRDRGMLDTEIEKLLLTCPSDVDAAFIHKNAFPSSREAVLYQFGNALDSFSYGQSVIMMQKFLDVGINENVLADIIVRKARWQLAAASLWERGSSWVSVPQAMMMMGKYPSKIWYDAALTPTQKRKDSEAFKDVEDRMAYMVKVGGLPDWMVKPKAKAARAEVIPMEFMANLAVEALRKHILAIYVNQYKEEEMKHLLVERCIKVYLYVLNKLKEIRYGGNPSQDLQEMIAAITSKNLGE